MGVMRGRDGHQNIRKLRDRHDEHDPEDKCLSAVLDVCQSPQTMPITATENMTLHSSDYSHDNMRDSHQNIF